MSIPLISYISFWGNRCLQTLCMGLALFAAGSAQAQDLRVSQPNAARFPEVALYAAPTDSRGVMLPGLTSRDFTVTENDKPATILRVDAGDATLDICLALDCSLSMLEGSRIDYAREAAQEFVRNLGGTDRAALITFADQSRLIQTLTTDRTLLAGGLSGAQPTGSTTAFYDALYWAVGQVALEPLPGANVLGFVGGRPESRRVVLALTDGEDRASDVGVQQVVDFARAHGVSLCLVALGSDSYNASLEYLTKQTGGVLLRTTDPAGLRQLYVSLAQQLRREYRLTLRTPNPKADATRREVRLSLRNTPLTASTWYQAPGVGSLLVTAPAASSSGDSSLSATPNSALDTGRTLATLLIGAGVFCGLTAGAVWWGLRRSNSHRQPVHPANLTTEPAAEPDLMPLWARDGSIRIGRSAECDLVLDSQEVSRLHARIEGVGGVFHLFDEGSANGTFLNGKRVRGCKELRVGDAIRFGDREFRFAGAL